jgi:hypothetical protein
MSTTQRKKDVSTWTIRRDELNKGEEMWVVWVWVVRVVLIEGIG